VDGRERKRGKLADLNAFLRGDTEDRFAMIVGGAGALAAVKYVITLDTDTQLPRDCARQLAGVMSHPLNRARFDTPMGARFGERVTAGYGILQPRVGVSLPGASRSWYARLNRGEPGIDPYTRAVSDVYQDVASEGSFIGKGIYDVDAFERALEGHFPDNTILSHDLLEGCYARSGLLSDVQLQEDYPATYGADMARRHRWIRGDWQLAGWLLPLVPGPSGRRVANPLSALSLWKVFDNLRRSLVAAALTLVLIAAWATLTPAWAWTLAVLAILVLPSFCALALELARKPPEMPLRAHLAGVAASAGRHAARAGTTVAFLPYEAVVNLDAIARTAWRMAVSRRHLLEWQASAVAQASSARSMGIAPVIALATAAVLAAKAPAALAAAAPILVLWLLSPWIAAWLGRPIPIREPRLTGEQATFLRVLARRTWAFFETCVGPADHWLPPDNFQEHPAPRSRIARRPRTWASRSSPTSPRATSASSRGRAHRTHRQGARQHEVDAAPRGTLLQLVRHAHAGATRAALRLLVDSGNLAGHLMTLGPGLMALADTKVFEARWFEGLADTAARARGVARVHRARGAAQPGRRPRDGVRFTPGDARRGEAVARPHRGGRRSRRRGSGRHTRHGCRVLGRCAGAPLRAPANGDARIDRHGGRGPGADPARDGSAGRRSHRRDRAARARLRRALAAGVRFPLRPHAPPALHRLQRDGAASRSRLLRPARLRGALRLLRRHLAGRAAAGELVRVGPHGERLGRQARAGLVERLDVRVPDAAARHAELRGHAARPDLPCGGGAPGRLRQATRRAVGHLRVRLQRGGREHGLPVPRVRCPGPGLHARARRRPRGGAVRIGARVDGRPGRGVREPAAARLPTVSPGGSASTRRSTTRRGACRAGRRRW
jgi:hypothetical protein